MLNHWKLLLYIISFFQRVNVNICEKDSFHIRENTGPTLYFSRHMLSHSYMLNFTETFNSEFSHSQRDFREKPPRDRGGEVSWRNTRWRNRGRENLKFP